MTNGIINKLNKRIDRVQRHKKKRKEIMGEHDMIKQDMRRVKNKAKAAVTKGDSVDKASTREAVKRVGEYKKGKFTGMKAGGQVCRGMGSAERGGRYGKDG